MTTLLLDQAAMIAMPASEGEELDRGSDVPDGRTSRVHGRFTLDEAITGVWEDLAVRAVALCPVCGGAMASDELPGGDLRGLCRDCGALLS
jgi:hypothetical protein